MESLLPTLLLYLALGAFAGVMAGLLGVGGGLIIVPVLAWIFHGQQINDAIVMHLAIGTSLATIVVTSISSVRAHHQRGAVLWPVVWQLTPGIVIGAWLGAAVADALPSAALRKSLRCSCWRWRRRWPSAPNRPRIAACRARLGWRRPAG